MSTTSTHKKLLRDLEQYESRLTTFSNEDFIKKPHSDVWSPAEVYAHIISANRLTIKAMEKAVRGEMTEDHSPLSWKARMIFLLNRIPKGRKVPAAIEARTPKYASIQEAREHLSALISELKEIYNKRNDWQKYQKFKHPALGMMNNEEWLSFMRTHTRHHLKQLDRVS